MKIVDGKCPYCEEPITDKPGRATKRINCSSCGRLLNLDSIYKSEPGKKSEYQNLEIGVLGSFLVGLGLFSGNSLLYFILTAISCSMMFLLWTKKDLPLPEALQPKIRGASERLISFPFELYIGAGWVLMALFYLLNFYTVVSYLFCVIISAAAFMAVQANRLYRESKVTSTKVDLTDFALFLRIMNDPSTAFDRKKAEKGDGESYSTSHFKMAEEEKYQKDQLQAENVEEIARKRGLCISERKKWEEDIDERYNKWLDEEYSRLKTEKHAQ